MWNKLWGKIRVVLLKHGVKKILGAPGYVFVHEFNVGDSVRIDQETNKDRLQKACEAAVVKKGYEQKGDTTYCNFAAWEICAAMDYTVFGDNKMMANQMFDHMIADPAWTIQDSGRANAHAMKGGLAIAAAKADGHGHVAVVYPGPMLFSGSLNKYVPCLANVGRTNKNGIIKASEAFPVSKGEPTYFLLGTV